MIILAIAGIVVFSLVLIKATDILVGHLKSIARQTKLGGFFLSSLIVGLATSFPELFVAISAGLTGAPTISLGNAIGANIANITIIAGVAALIGGSITIHNHSYSSDLLHAFLAGSAPLFLLMDNTLSRVDGLILIMLYGFYNYLILKHRNEAMLHEEEGVVTMLFRRIRGHHNGKHLMFMFLAVALMLFSAESIVRLGKYIAGELHISVLLVGLFFVSIGTSMPELVVDIKAVRRGSAQLFMGNMLGTLVANGTLVVGVAALLSPIEVNVFSDYLIATIFFIVSFMILYFFIRTKGRLERWEGAVLVGVYAIFLLLEFLY